MKKLLVVNTHKGLFWYNRLSFGPVPAQAIFQKLVDNLVSGIPHVAAYLDDVIVTGRTKEEHLQNLKQVLSALNKHFMKLRPDKCEFFRQQVAYSAGSRLRGARGIYYPRGPFAADLQQLPLQRVQEKQWGQKYKLSRCERGYTI